MVAAPEKQFTGIVPPVVTPFTEDNEVDVPSLERLLTILLDAGIHGLHRLGNGVKPGIGITKNGKKSGRR